MDTNTPAPVTSPEPTAPIMPEAAKPVAPAPAPAPAPAAPRHTSWGALIVIFLILAMIVLGAFYAWGQRIAQTQPPATVEGSAN